MNKREAKREACWLTANWIANGVSSWKIDDRYSPSDLKRIYDGLAELKLELAKRGLLPAPTEPKGEGE